MRNPIAAGADHPVEHPAGRCQARAAIGCDDLIDQRASTTGSEMPAIFSEPLMAAAGEEK